jgi:hypothetical protein
MAAIHSYAQIPGFMVRLSLMDFIIIQRALTDMKDEPKSSMVLENLRKQILDNVRD